jgi:hypothetical protein
MEVSMPLRVLLHAAVNAGFWTKIQRWAGLIYGCKVRDHLVCYLLATYGLARAEVKS